MNATIGLKDIRFTGTHGYYDEENVMGNEFSIDVEVDSNILTAATGDDLGGTINYSTIYYLVQAEMKKESKLLEALAYRVAARIQKQFAAVSRVKVKLSKLHPPLGGQVEAAFVEVELGSTGMSGMPGPTGIMSGIEGKQVFDEDADDGYDDFDESDFDY